jgi:hypothetical protein
MVGVTFFLMDSLISLQDTAGWVLLKKVIASGVWDIVFILA